MDTVFIGLMSNASLSLDEKLFLLDRGQSCGDSFEELQHNRFFPLVFGWRRGREIKKLSMKMLCFSFNSGKSEAKLQTILLPTVG